MNTAQLLPPPWKADAPVLEEAWLQATRRWPAWDVPLEAYLSHVLARAAADCPSLRAMALEDLFLTCACLRGEKSAMLHVCQAYDTECDKVLHRVTNQSEVHADTKQRLYEHLFAPLEGKPPRIAAYQGNGSLAAFLKVVVSRLALEVLRRKAKEVDEPMADRFDDAGLDPELQLLKQKYQGEFRTAFADAARRLPDRERAVLRYQVVEGLSIDQVGAIYGVHRATAARWAASGREQLLVGTQQLMRERLRVSETEMHSIMKLLASQLDASVARALQPRTASIAQ